MDVCAHLVQVNLQVSVCSSLLHVIVASVIKRPSHSRSNKKVISAMEDNRGDIGCV